MAPSPGTVNTPLITDSRNDHARLRAISTTTGRTSLQWTWQTRPTCLASIATASPPAKVMWPLSKSSPTSSPASARPTTYSIVS